MAARRDPRKHRGRRLRITQRYCIRCQTPEELTHPTSVQLAMKRMKAVGKEFDRWQGILRDIVVHVASTRRGFRIDVIERRKSIHETFCYLARPRRVPIPYRMMRPVYTCARPQFSEIPYFLTGHLATQLRHVSAHETGND
jgi:hypothetical protein